MFCINATCYVDDTTVVVIDKLLIRYQLSKKKKSDAEEKGDPIPVTYIPQKPHPNSLLFMQFVTAVECVTEPDWHFPYILNMKIHLTAQDCASHTMVSNFFN